MAVMIVSTIVVAVITAIGTLIWWGMMDSWVKKDRRARGRHYGEPPEADEADRPRVVRTRDD